MAHIYVYIYTYVYVYVYVNVNVYVHIQCICICTCKCIYVYVNVNVYVCNYMYIYIYIYIYLLFIHVKMRQDVPSKSSHANILGPCQPDVCVLLGLTQLLGSSNARPRSQGYTKLAGMPSHTELWACSTNGCAYTSVFTSHICIYSRFYLFSIDMTVCVIQRVTNVLCFFG